MQHTSTEQPEALRLADIVERLNVGVHSQAIAEEYSAAARELRRLHESEIQAAALIKEMLQLIEDWERCSEMLSQRVQELEAELAAAQQGAQPIAWAAVYFGGKRAGKIYTTLETEQQCRDYIAQVHQSNDSITLTAKPVYTQPAAPAVKESLTPASTVNQQLTDHFRDATKMMLPTAPAPQGLDAERLRNLICQMVDQFERRWKRRDGNAPGHGHSIPGVWDSDNGELAGKKCAWCEVWQEALAVHAAAQAKQGGVAS